MKQENDLIFENYRKKVTSGGYYHFGTTYGPGGGVNPKTGYTYGGVSGHPPGIEEFRFLGVITGAEAKSEFSFYKENDLGRELPGGILFGSEDEISLYIPITLLDNHIGGAENFIKAFESHPTIKKLLGADDPWNAEEEEVWNNFDDIIEDIIGTTRINKAYNKALAKGALTPEEEEDSIIGAAEIFQ